MMNTEEAARAFKALGDENRLRIARIVAERGDVCACRLLDELDMTQPTLSHHMKLLRDCGVVKARKEGRWMHYSLNREVAGLPRCWKNWGSASNYSVDDKAASALLAIAFELSKDVLTDKDTEISPRGGIVGSCGRNSCADGCRARKARHQRRGACAPGRNRRQEALVRPEGEQNNEGR